MISNDPILCGIKLIAEAWDAGGLYQVGQFPHGSIWLEWNGQYRDIVRQFIKGTDGFSGAFAQCLCGSPNLYQEGGRKPRNSINFICAHDGFTLADLVTYNNKSNLSNGEENKDGENHNLSWNCGEEGEFASITVRRLRRRQMRNFFMCLMVSQDVPMIYMGDEYGHTKGGNNNTYCHDNYINYFRWDKKEESSSDFFRFCRLIITFRSECESLGLEDFPTAERLQWHGYQPEMPDWSLTSRFVALSDFGMSRHQRDHIATVELLVPSLAMLRVSLSPSFISEEIFWKIYFALIHPKLNKLESELLSSQQV